ncbi:protease-4 [Sinobacterium caligoides]|uniref:Protease-4 n=1 Tax=Sinobacterium caligoides TaxID=933926 RepID=A0A3N2DJW0_9GAMM|nr:S49 family peptidase [Sinobacterium caligoides]ROS00067.1 protease-4 [Sinobacterium caligoides]
MSKGEVDQQWLLIEKLLLEQTKEQRRARRWGVFFKCLAFVYVFVGLALFLPFLNVGLFAGAKDHVALVSIKGVIADDQEANANAIVAGLRRAFEAGDSKAVIVAINSPGGSPVQSGYVYDEIVRLRSLYPEKKVYAVISDIGASGAYYIAAAADEIYADKASLVGSIGVITSGFGFVGLLEKLGIDRRLYTAGENKALLDPFVPRQESQTQFWQEVLAITHKQFVAAVKKGRGNRLARDPKLFSGLIWPGEQALSLGLIDGLGSAGYVAREVVGVDELVDYSQRKSPLARFATKFGMSFAEGAVVELGESMQKSSYQLR